MERGHTASRLALATGADFPDALAAAPAVAAEGAVIVLVPPSPDLAPGLRAFLEARADAVEALFVFGGTTALPDIGVRAVAHALAATR